MSERRTECPHRELAVGWALHCLEPAEETQFNRHLPECTECRRTVAEAEGVGATMALAVPDVIPPDELERRVLTAVGGPESGHRDQRAGANHRRRARRTARRRPGATVLATAAALVLMAVSGFLGGWLVQLDAERDRLAQRAEIMSRVMQRVAEPGTASAALVSEDGELRAVVTAADGGMTLVPVNLPPIDADSQSYVVWGLGQGTPTALDGFNVSAQRSQPKTVDSRFGLQSFAGFALSVESGNRLPAEPSEVIASGQVER